MKEVSSTDELRMQIILINNALIEYAKSIDGHELMATTLTGLFFSEEKTFIVQCGNTRAYVLQGSFLKQITRDQTTYQWLVATGNIEAAEVCNKSEIRGALGGGNKKFIDTLVVEEVFERGIPKMILLTSDGIHDVLNIDEIEDIVTDSIQPEEKIGKLIHTAIDKGSEDDCTAVIIEEV
jgi:protein phosphatase